MVEQLSPESAESLFESKVEEQMQEYNEQGLSVGHLRHRDKELEIEENRYGLLSDSLTEGGAADILNDVLVHREAIRRITSEAANDLD